MSKIGAYTYMGIAKRWGTSTFKTVYDNRSRGEKLADNKSRDKRTRKPTEKELNETRELLKDFGIKRDIPEFETNADLWRWRSDVIRTSCV